MLIALSERQGHDGRAAAPPATGSPSMWRCCRSRTPTSGCSPRSGIDRGDLKEAQRFLQSVPIVVAVLQVETLLVTVRFKLNAAALAAEQGSWARSQALVREATAEVQAIARASRGTPSAPEVSALVDDVEELNRRMGSETRPRPQQIRELARRTHDLGA
jgi:hypothetical protein